MNGQLYAAESFGGHNPVFWKFALPADSLKEEFVWL